MTTTHLTDLSEIDPRGHREVGVEHYRTLDAEYVIIGAKSEIGTLAKDTVNAMRNAGLRAGVVMLPDWGAISRKLLHSLAQTKAVGVLEFSTGRSQVADALSARFGAAADQHDWPASSFIPRVYAAIPVNNKVKLEAAHLAEFFKAMREYAPDRLVLLPKGAIKPTLSVNEPAALEPAREEKSTARKAHFASVA
jgi:pyruvate/2-oxoacid:ferredoxin oxidoreductase alpha subunit